MGSGMAAHTIGECFDKGDCGVPKDPAQAKAWYAKVASATVDISTDVVGHAATRLREMSDA